MSRIITTVSITQEQSKFAQENQINISALVQKELNKQMEDKINPEMLQEMREREQRLIKAADDWKELYYKLFEWAKKQGLNPNDMF